MRLPPSMGNYIATDDPAPEIKAYVDTVDFEAFEFKNTVSVNVSGFR
jgi:hypothetical protein